MKTFVRLALPVVACVAFFIANGCSSSSTSGGGGNSPDSDAMKAKYKIQTQQQEMMKKDQGKPAP